ncbi:MAG: 4-hydroxy-3-methylbut-2-enyl diphosphate reductase, partial [Oscillospiraceae bacterium]|nr:4-hydroxy-3-methylbut-2-enyl diphosphate reductase [Oscillospiraceae bacterium]
MNINVAESAGFCFGVNRAVNMVYSLINDNKKVCTFGPIIHNMEMVRELEEKGCVAVDSVEDVPQDATLVIRSHGVPLEIMNEINRSGIACEDATCPFVKKIHNIVNQESGKGRTVFVAGNKNHPEVQGIVSHCSGEIYTFNNNDELLEIANNILLEKNRPISVVAQTTFDTKEWKKCLKTVKKVYTNSKIFDTICNATSVRQNEAQQIAEKSDLMIVIGDRHSSNTGKLFDICKRKCDKTFLIETAQELDMNVLRNADSIGVTAGASTPARIIKEVLDKMSEVNTSSVNENELSFEEMLEESLKSMNTNERVMGTVMSIAANGDVSVDVGRKQAGYIPNDEISFDPTVTANDVLKVGDEVELLIMKTNDQEGTIMLSKKRVDAQKNWEELEALAESDEVFTGKVIEAVNGGVIVMLKGNRIFVPASQATLTRDEDASELVGKEVQFRLLEVSKKGRRKRAIGSIRAVLKEKRAEEKAKLLETLAVGNKYMGTVKSLTSYGAFVDIGGVYGMIHISELSWSRIKHPSEVVNVGDQVAVYIKDINEETKKISLGYKKDEDNPWFILENQYPVGTVAKCKIVG